MRLLSFALAVAIVVTAGAASAGPIFKDATAQLGSPQPCFDPMNPDAEGCYTHYVVMADIDGDGDLDLVFAGGGGYYTAGTTAPFLVYLNDGKGNFTYVNATIFGGFAGRFRQIAIGDVDGDGDLDIYVPDGYGKQQDAFFINDGKNPPTFTDESAMRLPISSHAGAVRFGDVDDDGDLDLVITDWGNKPPTSPGTAHVYLNDGKGVFTEKTGAVPQDTQAIGTGPIDIDLADVDGDFDLDLVVASRMGDSLLFLNDGKGNFTNAPFPPQPGPYVYGPDECDVDGDGDLDVWLDNGGPGHSTQLLVNDGTGKFTDETAMRVKGNPIGADDNRVTCVDIDGDGDFDAVIASLSDQERVLINDGKGNFQLQAGAFPVVDDSTLGLDVGDVDGDEILDVVTAQGESGPYLNRLYLGIAPMMPDTRPPAFRVVEALPNNVTAGPAVVHFAVTDSATTDVGPRVKDVYLDIGGMKTPATFMGGDMYRAAIDVPSTRPFDYRACATDLAGNSACSMPITVSGPATTSSGSSSASGGAGGMGATSASSSTSAGAGGAGAIPDSSGCGCVLVGARDDDGSLLAIGVAAALSIAISRRRRSRSV